MKIQDILVAIVVAFIWGFNFVVIELGLDSFPPLLFSALRFVFSVFPAILFIQKGSVSLRWIVSIGLVLGVVMFSLLFVGMKIGMPAGLSSLVLQIQSVFTLLLSSFLLRDAPTAFQKLGISIAFGGISILVFDSIGEGRSSLAGLCIVIAAGLAWAVSNILMKKAGRINMFHLVIQMSLIPPLPLFLLSFFFEDGQIEAIANISLTGVFAIFYTSIVSTVLAFGFWGKLLSRYSPNVVAPFSLLVPVFGMLSSWVVLGESFNNWEWIASLCIFAGLLVIVAPPDVLNRIKSSLALAMQRWE
ncbi:EamA family transporter [Prosthecochloris sp. SCSIO W1101]|uniref:EamA family transporter n=1 Tax=Prosthecochloris sp. SCSIO W1101 TaxID=2992242 RepID=UPI00223C918B|nr:EamA family transporter [Prosthecochloris sp. SCSIO W1101]UZJ42132.1 EamA family transporter [Prosthecochloris sp. SCSIO W1101]